MGVHVKICGVTRVEDAETSAQAGADFIGLNFWPGSPRCVTVARAGEIVRAVHGHATAVAVFVDAPREDVLRITGELGIETVQLHGNETAAYAKALGGLRIIKAIRVAREADLKPIGVFPAFAYLLDAKVKGEKGGTGRTIDWALAREACARGRVLVAGGLTPENVAEAVRTARPWGVDTASGVESSPGVKGRFKVLAFVTAAKAAGEEIKR